MEFALKELNMSMGKAEWEMFQDIPVQEPGSTNLCRGLPLEVFPAFLESQLARQYQCISVYDTPTRTFLLYAEGVPVGYIGIRTQIDEKWKVWSGNLYFVIRKSERGKGYGSRMLSLALEECLALGMEEVYVNASAGNTASARVIEKNGGVLTAETDGSRYYRIKL